MSDENAWAAVAELQVRVDELEAQLRRTEIERDQARAAVTRIEDRLVALRQAADAARPGASRFQRVGFKAAAEAYDEAITMLQQGVDGAAA